MPPTPAISPVKTLLRSIADKLNDLESLAGDPGDPRFKSALDQAGKLWDQLRGVLNGSQTRSIAEFFDAIGSSIVEAQGRLDQASEAYVRSAIQHEPGAAGVTAAGPGSASPADAAPALGTLFRIPRVTAELKCSLEMDRAKGFNVIFYTDRTDVRELHQQTVHLEVVAVPAPPDYINYLRSHPERTPAKTGAEPLMFSGYDSGYESAEGPLSLSDSQDYGPEPAGPVAQQEQQQQQSQQQQELQQQQEQQQPQRQQNSLPQEPAAELPSLQTCLQGRIASDAEREELRALVEKLDKKQRRTKKPRRSPVRKLLLPAWSRALVLKDREDTRFIFLATADKRPRLLMWQVMLRPASLLLLYRLPRKKRSRQLLAQVHRFLADLGAAQAALLRS